MQTNETQSVKVNYNTKRLRKLIKLKKLNNRLMIDVQTYIKHNANSKYKDYLISLFNHVSKCSTYVAYKYVDNVEFITSITCKDKLCNICNYNRKNLLRKKYLLWLEKNPFVYVDNDNNYYTDRTVNNAKTDVHREQYDLMHLTLTVPHNKAGYKGQKIYYKQLISDYNVLRKNDFFKVMVIGGEYGIEATNTDNGLNIHIHSLLIVRKFTGNRNMLHRAILLKWNSITKDYRNNTREITENVAKNIKKGNKLLTDADVAKLSPYGATMLTLENIYTKNDSGIKDRSMSKESIIKAVLETISYHFKPKMFINDDGSYDIATLAELYSHTKGMILYRKFGVLHNEKSLNVTDTTELDELDVANAAKEVIDEETGEVVTVHGDYFFGNIKDVYVDDADNIKFRKNANLHNLMANTTHGALSELIKRLNYNN